MHQTGLKAKYYLMDQKECKMITLLLLCNVFCIIYYQIFKTFLVPNRVILFRVIPLLGVLLGSMHFGIYQDFPTELYFEDVHPLFKIKTSGAVLVAS